MTLTVVKPYKILSRYGFLLCATLSFLCVISNVVKAENMQKLGSMHVHYMAIGATFLTPEIAKAYGIQRSRYNALIIISVLDGSTKGTPAQTVSITGSAKNNVGQYKNIEFKEVIEGDAIYYLAEMTYANEETLHFDLNISNGKETQNLKFKQKFYVD